LDKDFSGSTLGSKTPTSQFRILTLLRNYAGNETSDLKSENRRANWQNCVDFPIESLKIRAKIVFEAKHRKDYHMALTISSPPPSPVEPVTEILHGVAITDPYRWLEDQNSPRTRHWLDHQRAYARAYLDSIPGRDRMKRRVEELLAVETVSEPWKVGNRYFYLKRDALQEQPSIMMREGESSQEVILVQPADRSEGSSTTVKILNISRNGSLLAYAVKQGGADSQSAEFFNIDTRRFLDDRLPTGLGLDLALLTDDSGFYYSHRRIDSPRPHRRAVCFHKFGTDLTQDEEIFVAGDDPSVYLGFVASADVQFLAYGVTKVKTIPTFDLYLHDLKNRKAVLKVVDGIESVFQPGFVHHTLVLLTNWQSPNGRIVAIHPNDPKREHWRDIVPEARYRIRDYTVVGQFICVAYDENASIRIKVFDVTGRAYDDVPTPPNGTARILRRFIKSETLFYTFSSFSHPPTIFSYHILSGQQKTFAQSEVNCDPSSIKIERVYYPSKDGTKIPMFMTARRRRTRAFASPTFIGGYGGFGISAIPHFTAYAAVLLDRGFLAVYPNVRGGAEYGEEWHRAATRQNRQNAIDDFISAAEWVLKNGNASPTQLAAGGGSNGGLLVAAALTQRPNLFRAVLCVGPLLDMLRYHLFDAANLFADEFGTADKEVEFNFLRAYSPYHCVREGTPYSSVLFVSGDADTRCNPMHVRKMVARLQKSTNSGHPVLLDYKTGWGHVPTQPLQERIDALTDRLTFLCHELNVSP
jgi:prolyl oligopeptidase